METTVNFSTSDRDYLSWLNQLELDIRFQAIAATLPHADSNLAGWKGISSLVCSDRQQQIYDVDLRYAWLEDIFSQHLIDYGWTEDTLLFRKSFSQNSSRHKLIIYFCAASTRLDVSQRVQQVEKDFLIGEYWQSITHVYLQLDRLLAINPALVSALKLPKNNEVSETKSSSHLNLNQLDKTIISSKKEHLTDKLLLPANPTRKGEGGLRTKGIYKQSTPERPLISVITVVYNGERYLEQTIQSVVNRSDANLEYIIIDGGSEDKTIDIIKRYEGQIDYWISESDRGIYDAMNKGTLAALGSHTWHINADDILFQTPDPKLSFAEKSLAGRVMFFLPDERVCKLRMPLAIEKNLALNIVKYPLNHQGFIGLRNQNSWFDASYKIIADTITMAHKITPEPVIITDRVLTIHRREGISAENNAALHRELKRAIAGGVNFQARKLLWQKIVYSKLRKIARSLGLVSLKRKYF